MAFFSSLLFLTLLAMNPCGIHAMAVPNSRQDTGSSSFSTSLALYTTGLLDSANNLTGRDCQKQNTDGVNSKINNNEGGGEATGSRDSSVEQQAYLDAHNSIRRKHHAQDLVWNDELAAKAQKWADLCTNEHSGGTLGPLGENLAAGTGSFSIAEAVKAWTDEVTEYDPRNPVSSHFTQVVWKASTELGCAVQTCDGIFDKEKYGPAQYHVCEYREQGNVCVKTEQGNDCHGTFVANVHV